MYFLIFIITFVGQLLRQSDYGVPFVYHKPVVYGDIVLKKIIDGQPISFAVERLNIALPVKDGAYSADIGGWTLSDDAVYYAQMTALPNNQRGSTLIYGHNQDKVIARLSDLVVGDLATITTENGHIFKYTYVSDAIVPPDLTTILYDNPDQPRLTVMTCEGIWSQTRRLMYFNLVEAE
jgi:LPXTG-site transpeptidase (sortase) family protein